MHGFSFVGMQLIILSGLFQAAQTALFPCAEFGFGRSRLQKLACSTGEYWPGRTGFEADRASW